MHNLVQILVHWCKRDHGQESLRVTPS